MVTTIQPTLLQEASLALQKAKKVNHAILLSYSKQIESIDPLTFFSSSKQLYDGQRFFWSDSNSDLKIIGLGKEVIFQTDDDSKRRFRVIHKKWERFKNNCCHIHDGSCSNMKAVGPLLFGGFSFDPKEGKAPQWNHFHAGKFFVPTVMLTISSSGTVLTANRWTNGDEDAEQVLGKLLESVSTMEKFHEFKKHPAELCRVEEQNTSEWLGAVRSATAEIQKKKYDKIVLAREVVATFKENIQIDKLIENLLKDQKTSYIYVVEEGEKSFVSASPERLIKKEGNIVSSSCIAGSIRRGKNEEEDEKLGQELLSDQKNRAEHEIVVHMIHKAFQTNCIEVSKPDKPGLYKTRNIQHLYTPITGTMTENASIFDLIYQLHPTPAVGGEPRESALNFIRNAEPMIRGWYAAPVGWVDSAGNGEFIVALRSGLIEGNQARLFAGCGIVEDSDPAREFEETQIKLRPMLSALGGIKS
jgi:menaquinone-specific isochorismate synthase